MNEPADNVQTPDAPQPSETSAPVAADRGEPTLELRHLHRFFGGLKAVNDVSFKAYAGQVIGYIGPNGAGKTTSMRIIATLETPTAGDAFVCGYSVVDDPDSVRRYLGFMPDSFGRYANMNVLEYLDFYARAYGLTGAQRRDAIEHVLVFTELNKLTTKPINSLSKGLAQRLGLGRCLIHNPQVLILDEPAAGLDPRARVELRELIHLLSREMKKTILISSHILTELGEICDTVAIIEAGRILASGTIDEIGQQQRSVAGHVAHRTLEVRLASVAPVEIDRLQRWLLEQPLIARVQMNARGACFDFSGDDDDQHQLLLAMIAQKLPIIEFIAKTQSLEDAFMTITKGVTQ